MELLSTPALQYNEPVNSVNYWHVLNNVICYFKTSDDDQWEMYCPIAHKHQLADVDQRHGPLKALEVEALLDMTQQTVSWSFFITDTVQLSGLA